VFFGTLTTTTTTTEISTNMTKVIEPSDVFILVIPEYVSRSYLKIGDGSSRISATINAPKNNYAWDAAHALVKGQLHIFGGASDSYKIARLDGCSFNELPARLNDERKWGHAALSVENGQKALVCFGKYDDFRKSCEIFDGSSSAPTFAAEWTHVHGALGLYKHQPATVGCSYTNHQKAETLLSTGWTALPDFFLKIYSHGLVGLDNGAMLLLGGYVRKSDSVQTGIWELKEDQWSRIGELSKPADSGSAIYISSSVYYFEYANSAIHRLDLDENEELEAVEEIGRHPGRFGLPVLFQTDNDYCT